MLNLKSLKCSGETQENGNTSEGNKNLMIKKAPTKHCSWDLCNMDTINPERIKEGVFFIRFAKPGRLKETMNEWERHNRI